MRLASARAGAGHGTQSSSTRSMTPTLRRPRKVQIALSAGLFLLTLGLGLGPALRWARRDSDNVELREGGLPAGIRGPQQVPPWPEELARQLFAIDDSAVFDPLCGFRYGSNLQLPQFMAEHTPEVFHRVTNSLGLREDAEPIQPRPRLRVLVTGDSHTDGVCTNSESFANVLEAGLREQAKARAGQLNSGFDPDWIEVLNAGRGCYSFCNYYGVLARFLELDLAPDVFVVAIYGGNDFEETLNPHYVVHGGQRPPGKALYLPQVRGAKRLHAGALAQGLLAEKYFSVQPSQKEVAAASALEWFDRILELARSRDIEVVVAYIPPWLDAAPSLMRSGMEKVMANLELDPAALGASNEIATSVIGQLRARGVDVLDLRPQFSAAGEPAYWKADLHISLIGQRIVAEALEKRLAERAILALQPPRTSGH